MYSSLDMSSQKVGAACTAGFLLVVVVTLVVPFFPPAQFLDSFFGLPKNTASIWEIPVAVLLDGFINGFFWLAVGAIVYGFFSLASKRDTLPPMLDAPALRTPPPQAIRVDDRISRIPPALTVRKVGKREPRAEYNVEMIEGIGPIRGSLLRNLGVKTVDDLLQVSVTNRAQLQLAKEVGVSQEVLLKWICRGDLLRVKGVGTQYSGLLESAGVNSVADLSTRNPSLLHQTLKIVNGEKRLVRRIPPVRTVQAWVNDAKTLLSYSAYITVRA
jgi:predicted flap endonuclease-1-like 5' DNA nuclease